VMTCRDFGPDEAHAAGFLNRVVPDDDLDAAVDSVVADLLRMPKLALLSTKVHVNAVTESMVGTGRSWSDVDGLLAGMRDPEGRASSQRYLERVRPKSV
jgi:enoyl-CoA hydratase/carnithine racemase